MRLFGSIIPFLRLRIGCNFRDLFFLVNSNTIKEFMIYPIYFTLLCFAVVYRGKKVKVPVATLSFSDSYRCSTCLSTCGDVSQMVANSLSSPFYLSLDTTLLSIHTRCFLWRRENTTLSRYSFDEEII